MDDGKFYAEKMELIMDALPKSASGRVRRGALRDLVIKSSGQVSEAYLRQIMAGRISSPGVDKLFALSQAMGFPMDWWGLPVESGPPPIVPGFRAVTARLTDLPAERQGEAVEQLLDVLHQIQQRPLPGEVS
ncbi:MAG: hypothetical protein JXA37_12150 [Chloroflexia bacterium]|nr:hypothetical protein [Chloroflexia bacterium]